MEKIQSIYWCDTDDSSVRVGSFGVTRIETKEQNLGEYGISWLCVYSGDTLVSAHNARFIGGISYFPPEQKNDEGIKNG